jgi:hypothetical protein
MAHVLRVKLRWTGFTGAPGYSVFHFGVWEGPPPVLADAQNAVARIDTFITAIKPLLPPVVILQCDEDVEEIEDSNGLLQNVFGTVPGNAQAGTGSGTAGYSAAAGAVITWRTGGIRNGRRVRGRNFLVPLGSPAYFTDGTLTSATLTTIRNAADALMNPAGDPDLGVWARPTGPGATDGEWFVATSNSVPDMTAMLKSRRD